MPEPLVSVVIPTYERAAGVAQALDSIQEPELADRLEVIVVDNASTDDTEQVVAARQGRFHSLVYRRWDTNVGPVENWRRGIALAQAPWLKIIWSDDAVEPGAIAHMLQTAERNGVSVVTSRVAVDYPHGAFVHRYLDRPTTLTPDIVASELLHFPAGLPASPGAALVRTSDARTALEQQLPEICMSRAIGPDLLICYWGVFTGGGGVHLPDVRARFRAGDDSITMSSRRAVLSSCYGAALKHLIAQSDEKVSSTTLRRLRSRAALDVMLGADPDVAIRPRRLSMRACVYDGYQLTRHWITSHVLGERGI